MKNINKLIVPLFAMEGPDLSVKAAKLRNNIRHGKELDPVGKLPAGFAPDFAELQRMEADMGEDASGRSGLSLSMPGRCATRSCASGGAARTTRA